MKFDKELIRKYSIVSTYLWSAAIIIFFTVFFISKCSKESRTNWTIVSPSKNLEVNISHISSDSNLVLKICADKESLLTIDHLGLLVDSDYLDKISRIETVTISDSSSIWIQPWGENETISCCYSQIELEVRSCAENKSGRIIIRVFDDGIGWKYIYDDLGEDCILKGENTRFIFSQDGISWSIPANFESYEFEYREQKISSLDNCNTPMTFHIGNHFGSIHEAALVNMPEMTLLKNDSLTFGVWLAPSADSTISYATRICGEHVETSWRTIIIGKKAVDLCNSNLILNLNDPCIIKETDRINPMRYVGIWWGMHIGINSWIPDFRHGATTENAIKTIDFAAKHGIEGVLFEGWNRGWEQWGGTQEFDFVKPANDFDIDSILSHAHRLGVELIIHHETGGNIPSYERQIDSAYGWCEKNGIHYVKTGYAGGFPNREIHHSLYGVKHYSQVMKKAADHHLSLCVHEPIKPTGLRRTYPNLMSAEGARGMEWNAWSDGNSPKHTAILPYTRLLAGPMDYTPGIFDITYESLKKYPHKKWNQMDASECRVHSTLARQVALWTVIYSPLVMASDLIENYEYEPMFKFFEDYDPDIVWTRYLEGEVGRYIVVARKGRNGCYYLGAITDDEEREVRIPLSFLEGGHYVCDLYLDGPNAHFENNPKDYRIEHRSVTSKDVIIFEMKPGGGASAVLKPKVIQQ